MQYPALLCYQNDSPHRLHGSYSALGAGKCFEATEDLTGGVTERFQLTEDKAPADLFSIMVRASQRGSLLTCSVPSSTKVKGGDDAEWVRIRVVRVLGLLSINMTNTTIILCKSEIFGVLISRSI